MKTYLMCPVTDKSINERIARLNALLTVLFLLAFSLTQNILFMVLLCIDFYFRATDNAQFSPFAISSKQINKVLGLKRVNINAGPKIFAARIGLLFSALIIVFYLSGVHGLAFSLALILGIFSFLESAFGICVACSIYPFVYKFLYREPDE